MSLKGLLNRGACSEGVVKTVFRQLVRDNPVKVPLIFDGLDEFKHLQSCTENSVAAKIPVSALYLKILQNKLLRGATVLTTSRPNIIFQFPYFDRIAAFRNAMRKCTNGWITVVRVLRITR